MKIPGTSARAWPLLVVFVTTSALLVGCNFEGGADRLRVRDAEDPSAEPGGSPGGSGGAKKKKDAGAPTSGGAAGTGSAGTPGGGGPGNGDAGTGGGGGDGGVVLDAGPIDPNATRFSVHVKPVLERACVECHHAGTKIDLTVAPSAALADKVLGTLGTTMPPTPRDKLSPEDVAIVRKWKTDGLVP